MQSLPKTLRLKKAAALEQPEVSQLIRELRQLIELTQEQLAVLLGVSFSTINRWENGHMQPSPLALQRIRAVLNEINHSASSFRAALPTAVLRERSQQLLEQYFPDEG